MADTQHPKFFNRELSWVQFNRRVLEEAKRPDKPPLERLKFLSIVSSNFDEFFMVRLAGLKRQMLAGDYVSCPTRMTPSAQLSACAQEIRRITEEQYACLHGDILPKLARAGLRYRSGIRDLSGEQRTYAKSFFQNQIFPLLTPVRVNVKNPAIPGVNLRLQVAFLLESEEGTVNLSAPEDGSALAIVQIPPALERIIFLPEQSGARSFILLEDLIVEFAGLLFPGYRITEHLVFRVTRDADFGVDESKDEDFVEAMEQVLTDRDKSMPIRLTVGPTSDRLQKLLTDSLGLSADEVYRVPEPLELITFLKIASIPGFDDLKIEGWPPIEPKAFSDDVPVWDAVKERDVLLHHPFESFRPVVKLIEEAAGDPGVLAIKMTLYRTSGDSSIVRALERAAHNGKQVTVLVELKARFDEQRNIEWAQRLENAGVIVVYGIAQIKVHAKVLLIIRQERTGIVRYLHLGTGNYNERTAKLYTDMGLLTCRNDLCYEAGLFFNAITGYSAVPAFGKLCMAPHGLKDRVIQLIDREAEKSIPENPGRIVAKLNSLADTEVIEALYRANAKGVRIELNIRGICMLVPGVAGLSENIRVVSIVDRYLEHTRSVYFQNGGDEEVYLSSADWMPRNLERRVELMFPIDDREIARRVRSSMELCMTDRAQGYELQPDGSYRRPGGTGHDAVSSQRLRYKLAREVMSQAKPLNRTEFAVRRKPPKVKE